MILELLYVHNFLAPKIESHVVDAIQRVIDNFQNRQACVVLYFKLIPIAWFSFDFSELTCLVVMVHNRCLSSNIIFYSTNGFRYFIIKFQFDTMVYSFFFFVMKDDLVFLTFKEILLAANHCKRFLISWLILLF